MAEGIEKLAEVPVEFFKDGSAFVRKCQKPTQKGMWNFNNLSLVQVDWYRWLANNDKWHNHDDPLPSQIKSLFHNQLDY